MKNPGCKYCKWFVDMGNCNVPANIYYVERYYGNTKAYRKDPTELNHNRDCQYFKHRNPFKRRRYQK
jgi:hypothetical protein